MQGSLVLSLLAVLLAAANGQYSCSDCTVSESQANCPAQNCMEGTCILTLEMVFSGNTTVTVKACMENNTTCRAKFISLSVGPDKQVRTSSMCFQSNNFNKNITVAVPPKSSPKNGLQCAACDPLDADQCKKNVNIPCMGSEDHCIDFALTLVNTTTTLVLKGCATQSACNLKVNGSFYYSQKTYTLTRASCREATSKGSNVAVHALAFFPTLAGLLLVKQLS